MSNVPLEINAAKMAKFVEVEDSEDKRLPFDEEDMKVIFRELFIKDATGISGATLFWMVLLAPFTGCRLEEIGTLRPINRSEEHTSELQSLLRISYAVFCLKKRNIR